MAARGRELKVYLTSDVTKFGRGLKQGESSLRRFGKAAAVGVAAAGALAVKLGVDAVKAAAADEKRMVKLTKVLGNFDKAAEVPGVLEGIDAMQRQYGIAEDDLTPAFIRLLSATGDTAQSFDLLKLAMDLSAASGKSLDMSAKSLGRAIEGSTGGLAKMGVGLSAADIKAAGLEGTIGILEKRFGGTALAAAKTMTGQMDRLGIAVGEVQESFGAGIMEGFTGPDTDEAMKNLQDIEDDVNRVGIAIGNLGTTGIGWASDFVLGLEAISYYTDSWAIRMTKNINGVLDLLGAISDEEGQRRLDAANGMQTGRDFQAASVVNGGRLTGTGGGNLATGLVAGDTWGNFYAQGGAPRSVDPNRYKSRADDADARAVARGTKTRANP